ncbi:serine/threonine protein kinase with two-component sensor domain [Calothrix sp. NIES-2100]|uniref:hypothetical protein n=1 Tax=Calothrix sp. NIES-2100 TaxID=1954172 RepID=UPI000B60396B|nr:serine/threonine protein kinase with two-component sensor domain [Calothrix sp. NIES-2100]
MLRIPGYQFNEELYNGSRTLAYRGYREIDDKPVVMKLLKNPYKKQMMDGFLQKLKPIPT